MINVLRPIVFLFILCKSKKNDKKKTFFNSLFKKGIFGGKINFLFPALVLFLIFANSCRTDTSTKKENDQPSTALPTDFKQTENIVYARLRGEPSGLNPLLAFDVFAREAYSNIFPYLMDFHPVSYEFVPLMLKSKPEIKEVMVDGKPGLSYTLEILDEAVWDNGEPVTGYDYEFTLKAVFNPKMPTLFIRGLFDFINKIEIDKDNPKKFTILANRKYILAEEAIGNMPILPQYHFDPKGIMKNYELSDLMDAEKAGKMADKDSRFQEFADEYLLPKYNREAEGIIGCGPYKLKEWVTGQHIILEKKENWWGDNLGSNRPNLQNRPEAIHYKIIKDQASAVSALKAQDLDAINQVRPGEFNDLKQDKEFQKYYNLFEPLNQAFFFIGINNRSPKLSDKRVRRALAHLIDVDEIVETLQLGYGQRTVGPIHPNADYYNKELKPIAFNIKKAQELLAEAGWTDTNNDGVVDKEIEGERVEMELEYLISTSSEEEKNTALLFQENAKRAGVKTNIVAQEFRVKIGNLRQQKFELAPSGWQASLALFDPYQIWHTDSYGGSGRNYFGFGNQESDALIEAIRSTLDKEKRDPLYKKFQEIVYEEQPYIFLFFRRNLIAISKRFEAEASSVRPGYFSNTFKLK